MDSKYAIKFLEQLKDKIEIYSDEETFLEIVSGWKEELFTNIDEDKLEEKETLSKLKKEILRKYGALILQDIKKCYEVIIEDIPKPKEELMEFFELIYNESEPAILEHIEKMINELDKYLK